MKRAFGYVTRKIESGLAKESVVFEFYCTKVFQREPKEEMGHG